MEEREVIRNLKEHILHCINDHGKLTMYDRGYCIRYIMDFIFYDSADTEQEMTKKAKAYLNDKVLKRMDIPSEKFEDLTYIVVDDCIVIKSQGNEMLSVFKSNIKAFVDELKRIGDAI